MTNPPIPAVPQAPPVPFPEDVAARVAQLSNLACPVCTARGTFADAGDFRLPGGVSVVHLRGRACINCGHLALFLT